MAIPVERCIVGWDLTEPGQAEGHGSRKPENQLDEYRRMQAFLATHVRGG
jgi:hypothetical protein